jgi:mTERF domain-containing protein
MPRHYFIKILKVKGLVKEDIDFYYIVCLTEKRFVQKFINPYNKSITGLAYAYATACAGKMPHEDEVHSQHHARDTEKQRQR